MDINTEEQARAAIDQWHAMPLPAQRRQLLNAIETLELNRMYYDQKDHTAGVKRVDRCLMLLRSRIRV